MQCEEVKPIHLFHALNHLGHILDLLLFIENLQTQILTVGTVCLGKLT